MYTVLLCATTLQIATARSEEKKEEKKYASARAFARSEIVFKARVDEVRWKLAWRSCFLVLRKRLVDWYDWRLHIAAASKRNDMKNKTVTGNNGLYICFRFPWGGNLDRAYLTHLPRLYEMLHSNVDQVDKLTSFFCTLAQRDSSQFRRTARERALYVRALRGMAICRLSVCTHCLLNSAMANG